jgi:hypothetical protein
MDHYQKKLSCPSNKRRTRRRPKAPRNSPSSFFNVFVTEQTFDSSNSSSGGESENTSHVLADSTQDFQSMSSHEDSDQSEANTGTSSGCRDSSITDSSTQTDDDLVEHDPEEEDTQQKDHTTMVQLGTSIIRAYMIKQNLDSILVPFVKSNKSCSKVQLFNLMTELNDTFDDCLDIISSNPSD